MASRLEDIRDNPVLNGKVVSRRPARHHPGQRASGHRCPARGNIGRISGQRNLPDQPEGRSTPVGTVPRIVTYTVGAIFEVGIFEYDKAFVIMPMEDAQTLLMLGDQVGMIEVQVDDPDRVGEILAPLQPLVQGKGIIIDWRQMNSALFEALRGRADRDVLRAVDHRPGRGVQYLPRR